MGAKDLAQRAPAAAGEAQRVVHCIAVDIGGNNGAHRIEIAVQRGGQLGDARRLKDVHIVPVCLAEAIGTAGDGIRHAVHLACYGVPGGEGQRVREQICIFVQIQQIALIGIFNGNCGWAKT